MLIFENGEIGYKYPIIRDINVRVDSGEIVALVGPTGSGKTTLLMTLAGLLKPIKGRLEIDGLRWSKDRFRLKPLVGLTFQDPGAQLFNPTVYDEVAYSLRTLGMSEDEIRARVIETLRKFGIEHLTKERTLRLSLGQKRLVTIASIEVYKPKYVLLDEPTSFLDNESYWKVLKYIIQLREEGRSALIATHDPELIWISDKVLMIERSSIVEYNAKGNLTLEGLVRSKVVKPPSLLFLLEKCPSQERSLIDSLMEYTYEKLHKSP
ncbi:cobalt ABC transporter ATPase [Ignicoccus islandicus DSM 13165]|uniref:Cobalt ABC transporter ATPase n=1 Tax=Ignicoccus islandicus DSM 13165 TaxID=940295 RepID=A0A0U2U5C2_9CREN|nr:ABC transporter ATP-binding protein [Ignicoccus islandicus]ALU11380.1 cobalt ABC transporter ATPase [Ignicoccus islandicus DSM 13165]